MIEIEVIDEGPYEEGDENETPDPQDVLREEYGIEVEPELPPIPAEALRAAVRSGFTNMSGILNLPSPEWFIDALIPVGPVTILHGPSGSKKSFLLLDWMLCAATGSSWHGHRLRPGNVMYIVAEGVYGTGKRVRAWAAQHEVDPYEIPFYWVRWPLNFHTLKPEHIAHWRRVVAYLEIDYIVVDTLHMSISGADENSSKDMGEVFSKARKLAGSASLFFVHHDPKDGSKTGRGSGSIRDDADVVLSFAEQEKDSPTSVLHADKIKDGPAFKPVAVTFNQWEGDHETSLYVSEVVTGASAVEATKGPTKVDKCASTITSEDLMSLGYGAPRMYTLLHEKGYDYGRNTVAEAVARLKASEHEVAHLLDKHPKDVT